MMVLRFVQERRLLALLLFTIVLQGSFLLMSSRWYGPTPTLMAVKLPGEVSIKDSPSVSQTDDRGAALSTQPSDSSAIESSPQEAPKVEPKPTRPEPFKYTVEKGDTLAKIWQKNGGSYAGALSAADAFAASKVPLSSIRPGEHLTILKNEAGDIVRFSKRVGEGRTLVLSGSSANGYEGKIVQEKIEERERTVTGTVLSSFSDAALTSSIPLSVVDDFVDLFSERVEFNRDLQPGDTFTIVYTQRRLRDGTWLQPAGIRAASLQLSGDFKAAIRHHDKNGKSVLFDENGKPVGNYFLRYPVQFSRISSVFTHSRFHPVLGINRPHNGVDFAAPTGTPVRTVADGVVEAAGYFGASGNMIKIRHNSRYSTAYLHLSKISKGLRKGSRVSRGEVIGAVGSTGLSTGPHLHFSLYDNGRYVDPMKAKLPNMIDGEKLAPPAYLEVSLKKLRAQHEVLTLAAAGAGASPRA